MPVRATASTTASEAPALIPRMPGSASGLRVSDCISAPATPNAAPTTTSTRVRGRRCSLITIDSKLPSGVHNNCHTWAGGIGLEPTASEAIMPRQSSTAAAAKRNPVRAAADFADAARSWVVVVTGLSRTRRRASGAAARPSGRPRRSARHRRAPRRRSPGRRPRLRSAPGWGCAGTGAADRCRRRPAEQLAVGVQHGEPVFTGGQAGGGDRGRCRRHHQLPAQRGSGRSRRRRTPTRRRSRHRC